jgi:hypothetical protein
LNRGVYYSNLRLSIVVRVEVCGTISMHAAISSTDRDPLLTEVQSAEVLNLSMRTLQAWRTRRTGPSFVRAGRAIRYRRSDLDAWVAANTVTCNLPPAQASQAGSREGEARPVIRSELKTTR